MPKFDSTIFIYCDSQFAIGRTQSNMYNDKSRHIYCKHNTTKQLLSIVIIFIDNVKSKDNSADPLMKRLKESELKCHREKCDKSP